MADAGASAPNRIPECPSCMQNFENPKLLPCDHSLCEKCVDRIKQRSRIKCPLCNTTHDLSKVTTDMRLTQILEALQVSPKPETCELCENKPVSHHCENCEEWMCADCKNIHLKGKATKDHKIKAISTTSLDDPSKARNIEKIESAMEKLENLQERALQLSAELREKSVREVNEHFDEIDTQIKEFINRNTTKLQDQKEQILMEGPLNDAGEVTSTVEEVKITEAEVSIVQTNTWDATTAATLETCEGGVRIDKHGLKSMSHLNFIKEREMKINGIPKKLRIIRNQIWLCLGEDGIQILDDELNLQGVVVTKWGFINDVAETPNGDLVISCTDGLVHITRKGEEISKICKGDYPSIEIFEKQLYAYNSYSASVIIYEYEDEKWKNIKRIKTPCSGYLNTTMHVTDLIIHLCCAADNQVHAITRTGSVLNTFGELGSGPEGTVDHPFICQGDSGGTMLIVDYGNNRLQTIRCHSDWDILNLQPAVTSPCAAVFHEGKLYVVCRESNSLLKYDARERPKSEENVQATTSWSNSDQDLSC